MDTGYYFRTIKQTPDGGFAVVGEWIDQTRGHVGGTALVCLLKLDSLGEPQWERRYDGLDYDYWDMGFWVENTPDGGFIIAGLADDRSAYLVKTDSLGLVYTGVEEGNQGFEGARARVTASPNPFHREVMIRIAAGFDPETAIEIHDVSGRLVRSLRPASRVVWDGKDQTNSLVPSGVYFVQLGTSGPVSSLRLVLAR